MVRASWDPIYDINVTPWAHAQHIHGFIDKYRDYLQEAPPHPIDDIHWHTFKNTCIHTASSASGLDDWAPAAFRLLSDLAFYWLTEAVVLMEKGAAWPMGTPLLLGGLVMLPPGLVQLPRLVQLLPRLSGALDLRNVRFFVLDEADALLDAGNRAVIERVRARLPGGGAEGGVSVRDQKKIAATFGRVQTLLFSATLRSPSIRRLAEQMCVNPT